MAGPSPKHAPLDFPGILALWPSLQEFCTETGALYGSAAAWKRRKRIPAEHWDAVITAARGRGARLTIDDMMGALRIAMALEDKAKLRKATAAALAAMDRRRQNQTRTK